MGAHRSRSRALASLALALALACGSTEESTPPAPAPADELRTTARVIEAVLRDAPENHAPNLVVAELQPPPKGFREELEERAPPVRAATLEAFAAGLTAPAALRPELFEPAGDVRLVPRADIDAVFEAGAWDGWTVFRERFPERFGFWRFSPVGFSPDGAEALVYVEWSGGLLMAWGKYVRLVRQAGSWLVAEFKLAWIS